MITISVLIVVIIYWWWYDIKIYDVCDTDSDDDSSSYDDNICSDSYNSNSISGNYDCCYGDNVIDNGYDVITSGGKGVVMIMTSYGGGEV